MKTILLCLVSLSLFGQSYKLPQVVIPTDSVLSKINDSGAMTMSVTALSGTSAETVLASKVVKATALSNSRGLSFLFVLELSSGLTLLPNLSLKVKYGSGVLTTINSAVAMSASSKVIVLRGRLLSKSPTSQYIYCEQLQDSSGAGLTSGSSVLSATMLSVDSTVDQTFSITATLSTATGSVTLVPRIANALFL